MPKNDQSRTVNEWRFLLIVLFALHAPFTFGQTGQQGIHLRTGLRYVQARLGRQEPVLIACLGGSITENAGGEGFVGALPRLLTERFPGAQITVLNSGKGGTGSDFGAQRVDRDVLSYRPNLLIVEFAVNDSDRTCIADMERIVRKTWTADPTVDILFLSTATRSDLPLLAKESYRLRSRSTSWLPSGIRYHPSISELELPGESPRVP